MAKQTKGKPKDSFVQETASQLLAEHALDIIVRFDKQLRHVYVNPIVEEITGMKQQDFLGKTNRELGMPEELCDLWESKIHSVFRTKKKRRFVFPFPTSEGEKFFESLMVPEKNDEGSVTHVLCITRDVTEHKLVEDKIFQINRELRIKAKELELANLELEAFTSAASHDLRAPLRSIKGFSDAILKDYVSVLDERGKDYLFRIRRAGNTMESLIDSLLELSHLRTKDIHARELDLSAIAKRFAGELKKSHPARKADFVIKEGLSVHGDFNLIKIVIQNLFRNSWKFTEQKPVARIEFGFENKEKESCFYVRDNGVGFDMAYAHKLFQPFQRLHSGSEYKGSGIGLATVRRIVERHGGKVWAHGEHGRGATFYFTLES